MSRIGVSRARGRGLRLGALVAGTLGCSAAQNETIACTRSALYNAAGQGALVDLSDAQRLAVGRVVSEGAPAGSFCTGVLVSADWVITAGHCNAGGRLTFAAGGSAAGVVVASAQVVAHPSLDLVAFRVDHPEALAASGATPIPVFDAAIGDAWAGSLVEIAGLGLEETGDAGHLQFLVEPVVAIDSAAIVVDGSGVSGACLGDSGGPMLVRADDGGVRVAGILSAGSESCLGVDRYVRLDAVSEWLAGQGIELAHSEATACDAVTATGTCQQGRAVWCNAGQVQVDACAASCGWSLPDRGYRCVDRGDDACQGVDGFGVCSGAFVYRCVGGMLLGAECGCGHCERQGGSGLAECG